MRADWMQLDEAERGAFSVLVAFINGRLASAETLNWALQLRSTDSIKRAAVLHHIDSPEGRKLAEPWRTAWRIIEEYWDTPTPGLHASAQPYDIGSRVKSGDRTGTLLAAIVNYVAPRLRISAPSQWPGGNRKPPRKPCKVAQLLSMGLTSGKVIDPRTMGLHEVDDEHFLTALADALDSALIHGLDVARRLEWNGESKLYQLGQLYRAYFVTEAERRSGEHEPDEFHEGIAPCVKLLHFVADRLAKLRASASRQIVARWALTPSPIHTRLWAALARDPWIASGADVSNFLEHLDDHRFWDAQNFPEVAELRAVRFRDLSPTMQQSLTTRLRKLPRRNEWPLGTDPMRLARGRLYWGLREIGRIKVAGGVLPAQDERWFTSEIANFPELAQMTRLDDGFMGTPAATWVSPHPDKRYDVLVGEQRLSALESALGTASQGWDSDVSEQAWDWMRQTGNAAKVIADLEASVDGGVAFPMVWERFGWAQPSEPELRKMRPQQELIAETKRVLALLDKLPEATLRQAINGISQWMSAWQSYVVELDEGVAVWLRLWPVAVEATNAAQPVAADYDLNLIARQSNDREPMDLDTLNTPAGKCVGVFLAACPNINKGENPFGRSGTARVMRDTIIAATGQSGLTVRHRLIEHLPYFLQADPDWARLHLIDPLLEDNDGARSLWRALARQTQFTDVLRVIGPAMAARAADPQLGRESRRSLAFSIVVECLHALREGRAPAVTVAEAQQMIRALDDEVRANSAGAIQQFVREMSGPQRNEAAVSTPEDLFYQAAAPFMRDVWPQERSLSTPGISKALADLPAATRDAFVAAVDAIERFLIPFDTWSLADYGLSGDEDGAPRLRQIDDAEKAAALLRLLDRTIGTAEWAVIPYDLDTALAQIEKVAPALAQDPKFRRLATEARR